MSDRDRKTRREFLKTLSLLAAAGASASLGGVGLRLFPSAGAAGPGEEALTMPGGYKVLPWTGDNFIYGHRLRDGQFPPLPAEPARKVDFAIVGGGVAGLTAAYYLRHEDFLILEQYDELGGQSRGRSYRGMDYSLGAAYMGSNEGIYGQLFSDLGLKPVELPPTKNSWYWEGEWFNGIQAAERNVLYREMQRFIGECRPVWKRLPGEEPRLPLGSDELKRLDATLFASHLKGYDERFVALMDSFLKSSYCAGPDQLSALAGFYLALDLVSPSYVFKGGNPALATALSQQIEKRGSGRAHVGAFVWRVESNDCGASVVYTTADGATRRVDCKNVIICAPPLVALRLAPGLPDPVKAALLWFKYGAYLVANFCMPKKVFSGAYDNWVGNPFTFADIILAEIPYMATGSYRPEMGSVLTVYQPYSNLSPGRALLLAGDREEFASSLVEQLGKLVEPFEKNLEEVVLTRWGHAMALPRPGNFSRLTQLRAMDTGRITLAHSSLAGYPSAESAISAAKAAAERVKSLKSASR